MSRKGVAQVGVALLVISNLTGAMYPLLYFALGPVAVLALSLTGTVAMFALLFAALIPSRESDTWGSMWPLVGYDNAIDAIYTRGPWLTRFDELDEQEALARQQAAMTNMFADDSSA
ncbi:MAG: hypothetical protein HY296_00525 [Thaumarchaeota archaeon]|nr:hypothetical protein [Nitrososphaerota archaeon]